MAANLLAHGSDGMFTGMGFDGLAALSDGLLTMLTIPVTPPARKGSRGSVNLSAVVAGRRRLMADDAEVLLVLRAIWGLLR